MKTDRRRVLLYWVLLFAFFFLTAGITGGGYYYYLGMEKKILTNEADTLSSIANLKVDEISRWRIEKVNDAKILSKRIFFCRALKAWLGNRGDFKTRVDINAQIIQIRDVYNYQNVLILDAKGETLLSAVSEKNGRLTGERRNDFEIALSSKDIVFGDFYRCPSCGKVHIDIVAPVYLIDERKAEVLGALVLRSDPETFLYPLIQSWPVPAASAETLIVRREGEKVVFLNKLRHLEALPLSLNLPLSDKNLPAARAARGEEGMIEGVDYRNVRVMASLKRIPDSPWSLVAKIDYDEAFAPFYQQGRLLLFLMVILIFLAGSLIYGIFMLMEKGHYERLFKVESERQAISRRFEYLVKGANDSIILADEGGAITEFNERALDMYGYESGELAALRLGDLEEHGGSPEGQPPSMQNKDKGVYEALHHRKNGSTFHVEISQNNLEMEGKKYTQVIVRDVTERKRNDELLKARNEELAGFAYKVSHELKNNLLIIKRIMEMAKDHPEILIEHSERVNRDFEKLISFVDKALQLARSGKVVCERKEINLKVLIKSTFERVKPDDIPGELVIMGDFPPIMGDQHGMEQVFSNLISNSIRYRDKLKESLMISIDYREARRHIEIVYRDNGSGITKEELGKIFDLTYTTKDKEGFGFGLPITRKLIEAHGGRIIASSRGHGLGSEFIITLPALVILPAAPSGSRLSG